ncbi:hypothetical protein J2Y65_001861 [Aeromonas salmonicida]|uniref:hypothetical protein n=1 Tax=Aeromonas salmonicida TaxID=645 RepID=UPI0028667887|nr:hypothetical protein [Aeromonas salmonicida]MDR6995186.1 hypothetical protein [Aeromonas salmonicida]
MNRLIALLVALATSGVGAEENGWSNSWGPGTQANYTVNLAGTTLLTIICRDDAPLTMLATVNGRDYGSESKRQFALLVDGQRYDAPYRQGDFPTFWKALRSATSVALLLPSNHPIDLPTSYLAEVLPPIGTPDNTCIASGSSQDFSAP